MPFTKETLSGVIVNVISLMKSNKNYSYFVTGMDIAPDLSIGTKQHTSIFFSEKNRFELMFQKELLKLRG